MKIGEFASAADAPREETWIPSAPLYWLYESGHAALNPGRAFAAARQAILQEPG